ncbi:HesA/MoeB/ThiF family protein [Shewanella sp. SR44-3]|uniref:HesA/MoeB/ThiF family protein n=1 Tax=unclassified Shewanella TaxID=196818 RepID=UPI0015FA0D68|nr:HesA/MoeB/ThiF family protein [Shewanella sp. SR44-3]MBB1270440.1 HesA/MoeB/ThiF family protein [Shewanella sp. SR44-3]
MQSEPKKSLIDSLSDSQFIRYSRQIMLPEVDEAGQIKLLNAKVLVIGMGGLGQQLVQMLAAAGVGTVLFIDFDKVELSNLPRQLLYDAADIGQYKANAALSKLKPAYPDVNFIAINGYFTGNEMNERDKSHVDNQDVIQYSFDSQKLKSLLGAMPDIVFDCSDNLVTRHQVNQLCVKHSLVLVSAAVANFNGQLFSYDPKSRASACYHCLYPKDTQIEQSCSQSGVLGPAVAAVTSMQAMMGLNILLSNRPQGGVLHKFDGKSLTWERYGLSQDPSCPVCNSHISDSVDISNNVLRCQTLYGSRLSD